MACDKRKYKTKNSNILWQKKCEFHKYVQYKVTIQKP